MKQSTCHAKRATGGTLADAFCSLTVGQALHWASGLIARSGSDTPRLDAEVLLAHLLSCSRAGLHLRWDTALSEELSACLAAFVLRRVDHEPVAYLIGERAFYDVVLSVDRHVLIPRPETEHMVEEALAWGHSQGGRALQIVDIGTGSGALAVVMARHLPAAHIWATDVSAEALRVARRNIERYGLGARVHLRQGDLLGAVPGQRFDLILANLPYVPHEDLEGLMADVRDYEPCLSLDGGMGGTLLIERLLPQAAAALRSPGMLLLEIDPRKADLLAERATEQFPQASVRVVRDYASLARVVRVERLPRGEEHERSA